MKFKINHSAILHSIFAFFVFFLNFPLFNINNSYSYTCTTLFCFLSGDGNFTEDINIVTHSHSVGAKLTVYSPKTIQNNRIEVYNNANPIINGGGSTLENLSSIKTGYLMVKNINMGFKFSSKVTNKGSLEAGNIEMSGSNSHIQNEAVLKASILKNNKGFFLNSSNATANISQIYNNSNVSCFNNLGKLKSQNIKNEKLATFTNDGDLNTDLIRNFGEASATSDTVFINNADIHSKKIDNADGKFVNGGTIVSDEIVNSGHKAIYNNSGNINTIKLVNQNSAKYNNTGTIRVVEFRNINNDTKYFNSKKLEAEKIYNLDHASIDNTGSLTSDMFVNNSEFNNSGIAKIAIITNQSDGNINNSGELTTNKLQNEKIFTNSDSANIIRLENVGGGSIVNAGNLSVKELDNDAVFKNSETANIERIINKTSGKIENSGSLTSNYSENSGLFDNQSNGFVDISILKNQASGKVNNSGSLFLNTLINAGGLVNNDGNIDIKNNLKNLGTVNNNSFLNSRILSNETGAHFNGNVGSHALFDTLFNKSGAFVDNSGDITTRLLQNDSVNFENKLTGKISAQIFNNFGTVSNVGEIIADKTIGNKGNFVNSGSVNSQRFSNESGGKIENEGNMTIFDILGNRGEVRLVAGSNTTTDKISNENGGKFSNGGTLTSRLIQNMAEFKNIGGGTVISDTVSNNGDMENAGTYNVSKLLSNNGKVRNLNGGNSTINELNNWVSGKVENEGTLTISGKVVNVGELKNRAGGTTSAALISNESGGKIENEGNMTISVAFNNKGLFTNSDSANISDLNNELYGEVKNSGTLSIANTLTNKYLFNNLLSGIVTTQSVINEHNYKNYGKTTTDTLINKGRFDIESTGILNSQTLDNNVGAQFVNNGNTNITDLTNNSKFENMDNGNVFATNIKNNAMSDFINRGRTVVSHNFINNGGLLITSESRLNINGMYKQNSGYLQLTLNSYTDDALISAAKIHIANNTILKLTHDDMFDLGVSTYVLMESSTPISFDSFGFQTFKNNIDASGLGAVRWSVTLSADGKKLLIHIDSITPPAVQLPPLTEDEQNLINKLAGFDLSRIRHPYLRKIIQAFKNGSTSNRIKKMLAQSLTYTPANASVRVVRDSYSTIIQKILSSLTGIKRKSNSDVTMNYLSSSENNKYYLAQDMYEIQNDLKMLNYTSDSHGTDLFEVPVNGSETINQDQNVDFSKDIGLRVWADGLYSIGNYNSHNYFDKFKTNTTGFIAGLDKTFSEKFVAGLSVATTNSETKENSFSISTMHLNVSFYAMTKFTRSYFTNILSYGFFKHDQGRTKVGELLGAKYNTYGASFYTEYKYLLTDHFGMKGFTRVGLNKQSDIKEETKSGLGGLERNVDSITYNDLIVGYGMSYNNKVYEFRKLALMPFASADYEYNFSHKPLRVASYFVDMGTDYKFITKTDKNNLHKLSLSMGLSFARNDVKNPLLVKFMHSLDISSGYSNTVSLKFIKAF